MEESLADYEFRDGFFFAAENLARDLLDWRKLQEADRTREFTGVYRPMLYCYRHFVEVSLKHQIKQVWHPLSGLPVENSCLGKHALDPLWKECRRHMRAAFRRWSPDYESTDADEEAERSMGRYIREFDTCDPNGETFRYRLDKKGTSHDCRLPDVELTQLMQTMRAIRHYLIAIEAHTDSMRE